MVPRLTSNDAAVEYGLSGRYNDLEVMEERREILERVCGKDLPVDCVIELQKQYVRLEMAHNAYVGKTVKQFNREA